VNRREQIRMDDAELGAFLHEQRTLVCATIAVDGTPHVIALWYLVRDGDVWVWTYAASQKVRNLERDPRATLMVEAGEVYEELRGAMLRVDAEIEREPDLVTELGLALYERYSDDGELSDDARATITHQSPKRVAIRFRERSRTSWDHRKLTAAA
jgi:PPOX class probable F420-dependent enzyme